MTENMKLDLELYEILNKEINKELTKGCKIIQGWEEDGLDEGCIVEYISKFKGNKNPWGYAYWSYEGGTNNEKHAEEEILKVLGHYPTTNTVLKHCSKLENGTIKFGRDAVEIRFGTVVLILDITKEIIDQTDSQKQELISFLKKK